MRTLIVATILFALGACNSTPPVPANGASNYTSNASDNAEQADVNECPRRDGRPCL